MFFTTHLAPNIMIGHRATIASCVLLNPDIFYGRIYLRVSAGRGGGGWIENWFFFPHGDTPPFGPPSQTFLAETPVPLEHQSVKDLLEKFHIDHFILFWKIFLCFNVLM